MVTFFTLALLTRGMDTSVLDFTWRINVYFFTFYWICNSIFIFFLNTQLKLLVCFARSTRWSTTDLYEMCIFVVCFHEVDLMVYEYHKTWDKMEVTQITCYYIAPMLESLNI